jgi:hypothetical protein
MGFFDNDIMDSWLNPVQWLTGGTLQGLNAATGIGLGASDEEKEQAERAKNQSETATLIAHTDQARRRDLAEGRARGKEIFGTSFGKPSKEEERSAEIADILARRKANLGGLSAEENNALREQMLRGINQGTQGNLRQLRGAQAQAGLRGSTAASQQGDVIRGGQQAQAMAERDIFLKNIQERQNALAAYEQSQRAAEGEERQRYGERKFGEIGTELGYGSLGAGERAGVAQQVMGQASARAAQAYANKGKK